MLSKLLVIGSTAKSTAAVMTLWSNHKHSSSVFRSDFSHLTFYQFRFVVSLYSLYNTKLFSCFRVM